VDGKWIPTTIQFTQNAQVKMTAHIFHIHLYRIWP
jgi:hypothetical protein